MDPLPGSWPRTAAGAPDPVVPVRDRNPADLGPELDLCQPPLPAAAVNALSSAAENWVAHGPCPETTNGDGASDS